MENMEGEKRIINISELYADIFDKFADSIKEEKKNQHESEDKREQILQDLSKQLHSAVSYETAEMPGVSLSDQEISAECKEEPGQSGIQYQKIFW